MNRQRLWDKKRVGWLKSLNIALEYCYFQMQFMIKANPPF